jgi:outer membrane beta-barrel protein
MVHPRREPSELTGCRRKEYSRWVLGFAGRVGTPRIPVAVVALGLAGAITAHARLAAADKPSDLPPPSCHAPSISDELGQTQQRKGVQQREFLKRGKLAISPRGGLFAADLVSSTYMYGGELQVYLTERLGLWSSVDVAPMALDLEEPLGRFFGDNRFERGLGFLALGGLRFSPIHGKLKMGERIVHADLLLSAGAGRLIHESSQGVALSAGASLELFTTSWLTLRFDVRDVAAVQEAVGETRLGHNIVASGGVSIWLPLGW